MPLPLFLVIIPAAGNADAKSRYRETAEEERIAVKECARIGRSSPARESDPAICALVDLLAELDEIEHVLSQVGLSSTDKALLRNPQESLDPTFPARLHGAAIDRIVIRWMEQEERVGPHRADWEMMVYCLLSSATLSDAIERLVHFQEIIAVRSGIIEYGIIGSSVELRLNSRSRIPSRLSVAIETIGVSNIYRLFCWLTKKTLRIQDLVFGFPVELERYALPGMLPVPYRFGAAMTAFRIPAQSLQLPILRSSREVDEIFSKRLLRSEVTGDQEDISAEVHRAIADRLLTANSIPSLADIADSMGYSMATLRRRLSARDLSYRQIKERCRREIAEHILTHEKASIEDVAARLDFCDSDSFRAAFKEWTGQTPSEYRRSHAALDGVSSFH